MKTLTRLSKTLRDPRYYQIIVLSLLLGYGILELDFGIRWQNALIIVATALAVQFLGTRYAGLPRFDPLSPLITSMSLTLLLRTDTIWLAAIAASLAIGSKFLLRYRGKHVFNPANLQNAQRSWQSPPGSHVTTINVSFPRAAQFRPPA